MLSTIDYEKVDSFFLNLIMGISSLENMIIQRPEIPEMKSLLEQIDRYRNEVALEIERQGKRS